jgi:isopentenyl diphosphate isomerase/L-lactate dehydrogenase-like FMN-dependent dehydrogenase
VGRATLYGVIASGRAGAAQAISILQEEIGRALALIGCPTIADMGPRFLAPSAR